MQTASELVQAALKSDADKETANYEVFQTLTERDLNSQTAMFDYFKALDEIYVDQTDDLSTYEQLANIFDTKLLEYNAIMQAT